MTIGMDPNKKYSIHLLSLGIVLAARVSKPWAIGHLWDQHRYDVNVVLVERMGTGTSLPTCVHELLLL